MTQNLSKKQQAAGRAQRAAINESYKAKSHTGGFSDIGYITTGPDEAHTDTYVKQEPIPSRYLGKNMMVRAAPSGHLPSVYFDKIYSSLASSTQMKDGKGDTYSRPKENPFRDHSASAKFIKEKHKGQDFRMANYPKPSTGSGSFGGCFQQKPFDHMPEHNVQKHGEPTPKKEKFDAANFKTRPPAKGTYGMIGHTFAKFNSLYVVTDEMKKEREKDIARWEKKKALWEKEKGELLKRPTFKIKCTQRDTFDAKAQTGITGAFDEYIPSDAILAAEAKAEKKREKARKRKEKAELKKHKPLQHPTFHPSGYLKSGEAGYFNKFLDTRVEINQAEEDKKSAKKARLDKKKNKKSKIKPLEHAVWKPVSGDKSSVFTSLLPRYY